jgi:hypothetical protein
VAATLSQRCKSHTSRLEGDWVHTTVLIETSTVGPCGKAGVVYVCMTRLCGCIDRKIDGKMTAVAGVTGDVLALALPC